VELSEDLPVVIEIVDRAEKIEAALPDILGAAGHGVTTLTETTWHVPD
jgi:PII-like signaling protein